MMKSDKDIKESADWQNKYDTYSIKSAIGTGFTMLAIEKNNNKNHIGAFGETEQDAWNNLQEKIILNKAKEINRLINLGNTR